MLWVLFGLAVVGMVVLSRLPMWLSYVVLGLTLPLAAGGALLGGLGAERGLAPLLLYAVALGLLIPPAAIAVRSPRVAPPMRKAPAKAPRASGSGKGEDGVDANDIPGYEVLEKVGSGGMASVYRARRMSDGQEVALKIPMEQYVADAKFIRRFHREAEVAKRLDHENIVQTFEHDSLGVKHYMVMEFVDGRSLEGFIEAGELDIEVSVAIMQRVARALQHIHAAGIIHRDIKPANIMILKGGIRDADPRLDPNAVKLMDFGIAGGKVLSRLTMTGARVGTPVYMSPEQARGLRIDHRSDIYSLGLVFYEMLTGQTAFKGGYEAIVHQQIFQTPPPPRQLNLDVPRGLDSLIMRMISKDPDERPSLDEVYDALDDLDLHETSDVELASRLVLTVSARQGVLRVLDLEGNLHTAVGDIGSGPNDFSAAPLSVDVDSQGHLYAAVFEYRVGQSEHKMIHKLAPDGTTLDVFGAYGMGEGELLYPISLTVAPDDTVLVLDSETHRVQRFAPDGRFLHAFGARGEGQGTFNDPRVVVTGPDGRVYVLDYGNRQVQRFAADGTYETRWAFRLSAESDDMRILDGVTVDGEHNVYISDASSTKIRQVTPAGKVGQSFAIKLLQGESTEALMDLGLDLEGNLYVGRRGGHIIRKFAPSGRFLDSLETYAPLVQMVVDAREAVPAD